MIVAKILKVFFGLFTVIAVAIGFTSINHPIILGWVTGSVRHFGAPISATVYANGKVNEQSKVFYTDEPNNYLLALPLNDNIGFEFLTIDVEKKRIGGSAGITPDDYDFIGGHLFQRKAVEHYPDVQSLGKDFNPELELSADEKQIRFNMPVGESRFDSLRIELK